MKRKTIRAIDAIKKARPNDPILKYSSSLDDITKDKGNLVCRLRSYGMTKKEIAKKINKSDRYVSAVLENYGFACGLPKVMTKAAKMNLLNFRMEAKKNSKKK